jgi:hypothetical protein
MNESPKIDALLFPLLAVLFIVALGGGLGVLFMIINETAVGEWGVIALGLSLVVGVPTVAALAQRVVDRR